MPTATEIKQLASELHDKRVINLDASARDMLSMTSPVLHKGEEAGWYVLGGEHYVIVCGAQAQVAANPAQIGSAANPSPFGR